MWRGKKRALRYTEIDAPRFPFSLETFYDNIIACDYKTIESIQILMVCLERDTMQDIHICQNTATNKK